jgi:integrase/recombinase XerD
MYTQSICLNEALDGFTYFMYASGYSERTIDSYVKNLRRIAELWQNPPIDTIDKYMIQNYLADLKKQGRSTETLRSYLKNFRAFFAWAETEFKLKRPDTTIKSPPQKTESDVVPLSHEDIHALLKSAATTRIAKTSTRRSFRMRRPTANRDIAIILLFLDTGVRVSELARLKVKDIDLKSGEVYIHAFETGKKSRPRTVFLAKAARSALWRYLAIDRGKPDPNELAFLSSTGMPMNRNSIHKCLNSIAKAADVDGVHPHRFRHTFAIQYLRNGGDAFTLKRLLGHNSMRMVNYYLAISKEDVQQAHLKASPVDNWHLPTH